MKDEGHPIQPQCETHMLFSRFRSIRVREPFNGLSHLSGAGLSVAGLIVLVCLSQGKPLHIAGFSIYGASLIALYTASALYHLLPVGPDRLRHLLVLDHVGIYLLIAGTYTPICLVSLQGPWGWSLLGAVWTMAVAGIAMKVGWRAAPEWIGFVLYLLMGWSCVVALSPLVRALPPAGFGWLVLGGLFYTVGAVIFAIRRPRLWPGVFSSHELWHCFVLGGSICHFIVMLCFVAPSGR
jgi:hemolysin III